MANITRYDHPHFTIVREAHLKAVQSPAASLTDFADFRCRNKCIVKSVTIHCASLPSAITTFTVMAMRSTTTMNKYTQSSFSVVGDMSITMTLVSANTLLSASETVSLQLDSTEKGKFDVIWEYQMLLPASHADQS